MASQPDDDQQPPSAKTGNEAVFRFLKLDLELAATFLQLGDASSREETKHRTLAAAKKIYMSVTKFSTNRTFTPEQHADLRTGLGDLKHSLEQHGERF